MLSYDRYFYPIIVILFLLDIACFALFEQQVFFLLICFYIMSLYQTTNIVRILITTLLICLESSLYFGCFGLQLMYILPATLIGLQTQHVFYASRSQPYLLLLGCLMVQYFFLEPVYLSQQAISSYTPIKIIANIIVLWCMTLINNSQGKLGNRSN